MTVAVAGSTTTSRGPSSATTASRPSAVARTESGEPSTGTDATFSSVVASSATSSSERVQVTQTFPSSTAIACGPSQTASELVTAFVFGSTRRIMSSA